MDADTNHDSSFVSTLSHAAADPFRLLVDAVKDYGIFMLDPAGNVSSWNPGAEKIMGYKAEEIIGQHFSRFYWDQDVAAGRPQRGLQIALKEGRFEEEGLRIRKGETTFWAIVTLTNIHDSFGKHVGFANVTRDITERKQAEDDLRRSEERYRGLIETIPALVWVYDGSGQPLLHNHRWYEYTGQSPEDVAANRWHEALHPEDAAGALAVWNQCKATGEPYTTEYRIRRTDGVYRWFLSQGTALKGPGGIEQWCGLCTDIDARKQAEAALRVSEERYRTLIAATSAIVWNTPASGEFETEQPGWTKFTGQTFDQLRGWGWLDAIHPDDRENTARVWTKAVTERAAYQVEHRIRQSDGGYRSMVGRAVPIINPDGQVREWVGIHTDVTDRKSLEQQVIQVQQRIQHVVASSPAVLFTLSGQDADSIHLTWVSENVHEMMGFSAQEALEPTWWDDGIHPGDRERVAGDVQKLFSHGHLTDEYRFRHRDGKYRWIRSEMRLLRDSIGNAMEAIGSWSDISANKQIEQQFLQAQKMEAVGQLAGGVAHDFNNLLTIISGYSELLLGMLPPEDSKREAVKAISEAGERAAALTRQLLSFSRQALLETKVLNLNDVVNETEKLLRRVIGEDILLTVVLDPNLSRIKVDPSQMGQVLMNLAVNARDAMPQGGKFTIETSDIHLDEAYAAEHPDCRPGNYVKMAVSDNGCGMTPEVRAHIFEPFFTTKGPGKGTGLGLATVYGIVKQSGGSVDLYTEPGHGTTFKIYLPAVDESALPTRDKERGAKVVGGTETILLVEDDDAVRAIALLALHSHGYAVLQAESGKQALGIIDKHQGRIHLLVTDVVMPGMNGRELAETLGSRYPGLKVLYQSGYTDNAVIRHGILQMEVAFIQKPYTPLSLASKVREVLDKH